MSSTIDKVFGLTPHVLKIRGQRSEILAGNLANADTPHFKARDIDFSAALSQAMADKPNGAASISRTDSDHLAAGPGLTEFSNDLLYRQPTQPSTDGNTVEAHREHMAFMDNAVRYQASVNFLNSKIRGLLLAIKGE